MMNVPKKGAQEANRSRRDKVCVLASGGLDSCALIADYLERGFEVHPLYVRGGFYWEKAELHWLRRFLRACARPRLKALVIADAPMGWLMAGHWSVTGRGVPSERAAWDAVYLPGRNLVLLAQAGLYAATHGIPRVALAVLEGNPFADSRPRFLADMQSAVNDALRSRVRIEAPYARLRKSEVERRLGGRWPLGLSFSCLRPRGVRPCGACSKCRERRDGGPTRSSG